jgi:hypothetical protein
LVSRRRAHGVSSTALFLAAAFLPLRTLHSSWQACRGGGAVALRAGFMASSSQLRGVTHMTHALNWAWGTDQPWRCYLVRRTTVFLYMKLTHCAVPKLRPLTVGRGPCLGLQPRPSDPEGNQGNSSRWGWGGPWARGGSGPGHRVATSQPLLAPPRPALQRPSPPHPIGRSDPPASLPAALSLRLGSL